MPTQAEGAEEAELRAAPGDVGSDGVGDEEHSDDQGDQGKGGEVQLERAEHAFHLAATPLGRAGAGMGGKLGLQSGAQLRTGDILFRRRVGAQEGFDPVDLAAELKAGLDRGDVGQGEVIVGANQIVGGFKEKANSQSGLLPAMDSAEGVTDFQAEPVGKGAGDGDRVGFGDEGDGISGIFEGVLEPIGDEVAVGKRIDTDKMEKFAGMSRQGGDDLDDGGGFADGGVGTDDREQSFGQAEALAFDGEVGPAGDEIQ